MAKKKMISNKAEYPYVLIDESGCNKPAFYLKSKPRVGEYTDASEAIGVNGEVFSISSLVCCTSCGRALGYEDADVSFIYKRKEYDSINSKK